MTLKILSFGAGAIGTYIGGSLVQAGNQVVFLERPEVVAELRQRGLRLLLSGQEIHIQKPVLAGSIDEALSLGTYDVAIFALKSFDTQAALESMKHYRLDLPPLLCLQNGVENELIIETVLGKDKVIAGTVTSAIGRQATGDIILERLRGIGVAAGHHLSTTLVQVLNEANLNAHLFARSADMKWSKMLTNLVSNATSAILDMPPASIFSHPGLYRLEISQLRETLAVMRAQNIGVVDLPSTPVRLLAFGARFLPLKVSRPLLGRAAGSGRGGKMPSFHIDLHSGRGQSEVDYLNGAVVRYGIKLGISVSANQLLTETLLLLTNGQLDRETFTQQPEKLLERWKN